MSKKGFNGQTLGTPSTKKIQNPERENNKKIKPDTLTELEKRIERQCKDEPGRPTVAELKELKLIEYLCRRGAHMKFIYEEINSLRDANEETSISYPTFLGLKKRFPQFFASITDWKEAATAQVESALFKACLGEGRKESSVQAQQYWLNNMKKKEWSTTQVIEMPDMGKLSEEELIKIINNEIKGNEVEK